MHLRVLVDLLSSSFDLGFLESFFFSSWPSGISGSCSHNTEASKTFYLPKPSTLVTELVWYRYSYDLENAFTQHIFLSNIFIMTCYSRVHMNKCTYCPYWQHNFANTMFKGSGLWLCYNTDGASGATCRTNKCSSWTNYWLHLCIPSTGTPWHAAASKFHTGSFYDIISKLLIKKICPQA